MNKKIFIILIPIVLGTIGWGVWATSNPHSWTSGLVGYWSFDGQYTTSTAGTRDVSNNGNWGAFYNGANPIGGVSGQALNLDGVNDYVRIEHNSAFNFGTGDFTWEFWVNSPLTGNRLFYKDPNWAVVISASSKFFFRVWQSVSDYASLTSSVTPQTNTWYHFVAIRRSSALEMYIDGIQDTAASLSTAGAGAGSNIDSTQFISIGSEGGSANFWKGLVDEVRIYNRALSAGEVKQHYDQTRRNLKVNQPSGTPPVGWWKLDEGSGTNVKDWSVSAKDATMTWMATSTNGSWTDGKIGKALSFDGIDDYIRGSTLPFTTYPGMTIEAWVTRTGTGRRMIVSMGYAPWQLQVGLAGTDRLSIELNIGGVYYHLSANTTPLITNDGKWHHIVFTHTLSTGTWTFYIDGVAAGTGTQTGASYAGSDVLRIGINNNLAGGYWQGLIDEVRIYNYARTAEQITADYQAGAYRTTVGSSVPSNWWTSGLVSYWSFDGQYTTTTLGANAGTKDVSGNGNWGTFYNGVGPKAGIVGQALSFDGTNDYINTVNTVLFTTEFTIESWFYKDAWKDTGVPNADGGKMELIIGKWDRINVPPDTDFGYYFGRFYGGANFGININNGADGTNNKQAYVAVGAISTGAWHHAVATFKGSNYLRLYIDGVLVNENTTSIYAQVGDAVNYAHQIGRLDHGYGEFMGKLDEVRIYNRALTADEILQHYQQTRRNLTM